MALEAVVFSQEYNLCNDIGNISISNNLGISYDFGNYSSMLLLEDNETLFPTNNDGIYDIITPIDDNVNQWDHHTHQKYNVPPEQIFCSGEAQPAYVVVPSPTVNTADGGGRRKRRRRSRKNKEEVEQQRMTHITVERNRRKQMNEYLAVIRSLMPPSYIQRGDQASIVGGAINYVKELEQMLQSMEAQKKNKMHHSNQNSNKEQKLSSTSQKGKLDHNEMASSSELPTRPVFADFFSFPQYSTRSDSVTSKSAVGEIEVTLVESHANVKILTKKLPKQLIKLIAAFQGLRLNVLHLNVTTTVDSFVLYSLSLKVEEGCQLNSVDDIAAAANHILAHIQEEAIGLV